VGASDFRYLVEDSLNRTPVGEEMRYRLIGEQQEFNIRSRVRGVESPGCWHSAQSSYFDAGEPMPVVVLAGMAPIHFLASALEIPRGVSELEWIGGVVGEPVACVAGRHTGLSIPIGAEIAIEGFVHPNSTQLEGPFGEWTGYYASASRDEPVIDVTAIYHRDDPILLGCPPDKPPYEAQRFQQYPRSGNLRRQVRAAGVPNVVAAWTHAAGGCRLFNVISIKNSHPGHARQTLYVASQVGQASYLGRIVVVVESRAERHDPGEQKLHGSHSRYQCPFVNAGCGLLSARDRVRSTFRACPPWNPPPLDRVSGDSSTPAHGVVPPGVLP